MSIDQLKVSELKCFLEVAQDLSIRKVARNLDYSPAYVSKAVSKVEKQLEIKLFERSQQGLLLTSKGKEIFKELRDIVQGLEKLQKKDSDKSMEMLTIASTSYMSQLFLSKIFKKYLDKEEDVSSHRLRFVDVIPDQMVSMGLRSSFELCFHTGKLNWPSTWTSKKLGNIQWVLVCRKDHPLKKKNNMENVLQYSFVIPSYYSAEGFRFGNDLFPVSIKKRNVGSESSTAITALSLVEQSNQLCFVPSIICEEKLSLNKIKIIEIKEMKKVSLPVYLSVKSDRVKKKFFDNICQRVSQKI